MTLLKDLFEYLDYLDNCSDGQFLKFVDAMKKRGYEFVSQYLHDYDYPHVTHCKDCCFYGTFQRKHYCTKYDHAVKQDGFCAWAEPKEKDNDRTDL